MPITNFNSQFDDLQRTYRDSNDEQGLAWLQRLPALLSDLQRRWKLTLQPPFRKLSYNYAARAEREDGTSAVLKVCPLHGEFETEVQALRTFNGMGAVQLLAVDEERGALLLEALEPGEMLTTVQDDAQATHIAAAVMKKLWRPPPPTHSLPSVVQWAAGLSDLRVEFRGGTGPYPEALVDRAERLFSELLGSMGETVVLHGDLHHFNILSARREPWLAIDPKGVLGEREYETGALLRNPIPELLYDPHPRLVLERRIDQLAEELNFDRERVVGWAVAQAMLAEWWSYVPGSNRPGSFLPVAQLLADL